jgi:DNA-binding MarR family transcriptional regulator
MSRPGKPTPPTGIPRIGEGKRGPQGHLGYLVRQANVAVRAALERALTDVDVTPPQFAVLTMIVSYPGLSGADLARLTFLTPQTINVIVRNLERAGLVAKTAHAEHGRILQLAATRRGVALLKRCRSRVQVVEKALSGLLNAPEEKTVRRWLSAVAEALAEGRQGDGKLAKRGTVG